MSVTVFAIVAIMRQSTDLQVSDYHRRQARAIIMNLFETTFAINSWSGAGNFTNTELGFTINQAIGGQVTVQNIPIDQQVGNNTPLQGIMTIVVTPGNVNPGDGTALIPVADVRITLEWQDYDETDQVITMEKRLAQW